MVNTRRMAAAKAGEGSDVARAESSNPPPRKKMKTSKDATSPPKRRAKISLTRLLDLPPEVFNEVATHLLAADLLSLARANKFFRKMFMSRTSQSLWKRAINNTEGLPGCPPQLSEPAYTSLIYSKTCSSCGARALRPMDPYLLVRFCNKCRDNQTFALAAFDPLCVLLPRSHAINMVHRVFVLRTDFRELAMRPEIHEWDSNSDWYKDRIAKIEERQDFGFELEEFLEMIEDEREAEMDELKSQRWRQIKERIIEKGWMEEDMVPSPANQTEWRKLVSQPKPLTDRTWTNLYPKLIPLLQTNREYREKTERENRRRLRIWRVQDLFAEMRSALPPLVHVTQKRSAKTETSEPSTSSVPTVQTANYPDVKLSYPFPSTLELLAWPMIKAIVDDDTSPEEAETKFEAIRDEVDQKVGEWRDAIERGLIEIWNSRRDQAKEEATKPNTSEEKRREKTTTRATQRKGKGRAVAVKKEPSPESKPLEVELVLPEFTVTFAKLDGTTTTNISDLSPNLQLLLRADTIFKTGTLEYTYPAIVSRAVPNTPMTGMPDEMSLGARWNPDTIERDDECSMIAKALLARMGRPNATSAEMKALGENFRCGRCMPILSETWDHLVHHFCKEQSQWKRAHEIITADSKPGLVYNNTHSLDFEIEKPFAHFMTPHESADYMMQNTAHHMPMMRCVQCQAVGIDTHLFYSVGDADSPIMKHLRDVHSIPTGVLGLDFRRWEWDIDFYDPWEDDYGDEDDSDSDMDDYFWDLMF